MLVLVDETYSKMYCKLIPFFSLNNMRIKRQSVAKLPDTHSGEL